MARIEGATSEWLDFVVEEEMCYISYYHAPD